MSLVICVTVVYMWWSVCLCEFVCVCLYELVYVFV